MSDVSPDLRPHHSAGARRPPVTLVKLITRGRMSGLPHIVIVRSLFVNDAFYVATGKGSADWASNIRRNGLVQVRVGELVYDVSPSLAGPEERELLRMSYTAVMGRKASEEWYGSYGRSLRLQVVGAPRRRGGGSGESEARSTLPEWKKRGVSYYQAVAEAFDSAAEEYDFTINRNFINTWIRSRSLEVLRKYLRKDDTALEIGCGTGAEALRISKEVRTIIATDISEGMIELLVAKTKAYGLEGKVFPIAIPASQISRIKELAEVSSIHVAYSLNGALNCEPRLEEFVKGLHSILEPGSFFVCSVRNILCLSEVLSHAAVLQFDRAVPRKRQPLMVSVGGLEVPSYYYPPAKFADAFSPYFRVERMIGLPSLLPPAYLNEYYLKFRRLTAGLEWADRALSGMYPFNRFGDQTLFVFRKKP